MKRRVTILGAGPAGLWAALSLLEKHVEIEVTVLEKEGSPGGITGSFRYRDLVFDYGSHRLHPATSSSLMGRISDLLGDDLLKRPRNGRIWLEKRFISFPLKPVDLIFHLPFSFSFGVVLDSLTSVFSDRSEGVSFEDTLRSGLGKTISTRFYFPYAEKLWGLSPSELSPVQAKKRIASSSIGKMMKKVLSSVRGSSVSSGYFYYPVNGFGQIASRAADSIVDLGGKIMLDTEVVSVIPPSGKHHGTVVTAGGDRIETDFLFSTIPISDFMRFLDPVPPPSVVEAAGRLLFRSMVFCFVEVRKTQYTSYDAHYFPGLDTCFSRLSEPRNYSSTDEPHGRTGLCFEIPCTEGDGVWSLDDDGILKLVLDDLAKTDLPEPEVASFVVKRKRNIYPVYDHAFSLNLGTVEEFLKEYSRMVSFGRQGLFVHDNTHHTMEMGVAAADCLSADLRWNAEKWADYRELFSSHVVVD
ncbi:MAG: hypothetical protein B1H09_02620 [Gemmatimonadaceae bacterium 4484_173]|nr:MAG: hypothetical protein B1H09_02620 [Gemmatimonadaceae bacterium 4484_173]RKZ02351.1 MAG: hypothetical protein DRQ21_08940 [Candidatus Fermentibacteria bacterium]